MVRTQVGETKVRLAVFFACLAGTVSLAGCSMADNTPDDLGHRSASSSTERPLRLDWNGSLQIAFAVRAQPDVSCEVRINATMRPHDLSPYYWIERTDGDITQVAIRPRGQAVFVSAAGLISSDQVWPVGGEIENEELVIGILGSGAEVPFLAAFNHLAVPSSSDVVGSDVDDGTSFDLELGCTGDFTITNQTLTRDVVLFDQTRTGPGVGVVVGGRLRGSAVAAAEVSLDVTSPSARFAFLNTGGAGVLFQSSPSPGKLTPITPLSFHSETGSGGPWSLSFTRAGGMDDAFYGLLAGDESADLFAGPLG